ncbi:hypothetical protein CTI12_AA406470 [Artemisia annua]|uniref:Ubiquitin-like protease family profile domain-containing protein n=1 Tax=Artemisia annua TaxID=35608 RepID=A0A2U1M968_ARTAN|nr:hypothetical protein CTI12_AA406470 [Artemisia annua]
MDVPRKWPAIKYWSHDLLEERQDKEMARNEFGMVIVIEEDEENENEKLKQVMKIKDAEKEDAAKAPAEKEAAEKAVKEADAKEAAAKAQAEKEATAKAVKEAVAKEAAAKAQAEKEAAEKAVKEAAAKEAAAKAQAEKEAAAKTVKEVDAKEAAAKAQAEKEAAAKAVKEAGAKEAAAKAQAEKEVAAKAAEEAKEAAKKKQKAEADAKKQKAAERKRQQEIQKLAKEEAKKKQEAEKQPEALKLKAEQEKAHKEDEKRRKAAAKELNEKSAKEKAEKEAAKQAEILEYETPLVQEKPFGTRKEIAEASMENEKKEGKRIVKPSIYLQSPYNNKMSNVMEPLTEDETLLAHSLLSMEGYILDEMFDDGKGTMVPRITMQSISPRIQIDSQGTMVPRITMQSISPRIQIDSQIKELVNIIDKDETSYKLRDVKLVFFPIIAHGHYYVTVFDLEKGHAVILDNNISDGDYDGKYKEIFVFVKEVLVHYLFVTKHPTLNKVVKEAPPKISKMKWKTKENKIDCGLYMMMHMEMFEGEIGLKWKTNIVDEKNRQYADMMKTMRMR